MVGLVFLGIFVVLGITSLWVKELNDELKDHPDYKEDDLFDEDLKDSE